MHRYVLLMSQSPKLSPFWIVIEYLALFDHVSRAHEIEIHRSVGPSVRPLSVSQLSLNLIQGFLSNFSCCFPWVIRSDVLWIFEKKSRIFHFFKIFFFFIYVNMRPYGSKISKRYSSYKSQPKVFKHLLNFLTPWSSKNYDGIIEILKIEILMILLRFRQHGAQWEWKFQNGIKCYEILQIAAKSFQTCPEFSCQWSSQNYLGDLKKIEFLIFNELFF